MQATVTGEYFPKKVLSKFNFMVIKDSKLAKKVYFLNFVDINIDLSRVQTVVVWFEL